MDRFTTIGLDSRTTRTTEKRRPPPIIERANLLTVNIEITPTQNYAQVKETLWSKKYPDENSQGDGTVTNTQNTQKTQQSRSLFMV